MLFALYILATTLLPVMGNNCIMLVNELMPALIVLVGIVMMLGAVGMPISNRLGSTIVGGFFSAVGFLVRQMFEALGWLVRQLPTIYRWIRQTLSGFGLSDRWSGVVAALLTLVILV